MEPHTLENRISTRLDLYLRRVKTVKEVKGVSLLFLIIPLFILAAATLDKLVSAGEKKEVNIGRR